ncbi:MAG: mercury transporter [Defluviitaleaceae bacterium]|nr:mercury transporter [Defluviitaleaceae bacterium]MCL2275173.1 mercury transporter [Defluviitaleaceae bacterium]
MTIDDITSAVMILVRLGVVARFIFCMVKLIGADEEAMKYKKRAKNAVLFWIIAESVWILRDIVFFYYQ